MAVFRECGIQNADTVCKFWNADKKKNGKSKLALIKKLRERFPHLDIKDDTDVKTHGRNLDEGWMSWWLDSEDGYRIGSSDTIGALLKAKDWVVNEIGTEIEISVG